MAAMHCGRLQVAYVSKSGGMSNELAHLPCLPLRMSCFEAFEAEPNFAGQNNIIARNSNGVYEGVAIGGDRHGLGVFKFDGEKERQLQCQFCSEDQSEEFH